MKMFNGLCLCYSLFFSALVSAHAELDMRMLHINEKLATDIELKLVEQTNNAHLYLARGELYSENQYWDLAWQDFQRAMDISDNANLRVDILFYMGRMRLQSGAPDEAYELLAKVIAIDPGYKSARLNLARTYISLDEYRAAVDEMDIFISLLQQATPEQYIERASMAKLIHDDGAGLAVEGLNEGLDKLGPVVSLIDLLVDSYLEQGKAREALEAIDLLPINVKVLPRWQLRKGDIYQRLQRYFSAQTAYSAGLTTISKMPEYRQLTPAVKALKEQLTAKLIE